jgi:hypothetical protein
MVISTGAYAFLLIEKESCEQPACGYKDHYDFCDKGELFFPFIVDLFFLFIDRFAVIRTAASAHRYATLL